MYAIIDDRGHQYKVQEGTRFDIQLPDGADDAKSITFDRVLIVGDTGGEPKIGKPTVSGTKVVARILGEIKGEKITIQKFRRRKNYRRKTGHRQRYMRVQVESIG